MNIQTGKVNLKNTEKIFIYIDIFARVITFIEHCSMNIEQVTLIYDVNFKNRTPERNEGH